MPGRDNGHMLSEHWSVRSMPDRGARLGSTELETHTNQGVGSLTVKTNKSKKPHVLQMGFLHGQLQKVPLREANGSLGKSQLELKDQCML